MDALVVEATLKNMDMVLGFVGAWLEECSLKVQNQIDVHTYQ